MMTKVLAVLCLIIMLCSVGCMSLSSYLTPADIDGNAVKYVTKSGVADANKYTGYKNLYMAELLKNDIDAAYKLNQLEIQQAAEKNELDYSIYSETANANFQAAKQREESIFGPTGILISLMMMGGAGGFAGVLGLMRKRPGDITPEEFNSAIAQATGTSAEELAAKEKQLMQVIKSVSAFKDTLVKVTDKDTSVAMKTDEVLKILKTACNENQDTDTQVAVASTIKQTA
jgi:hypothetical protein